MKWKRKPRSSSKSSTSSTISTIAIERIVEQLRLKRCRTSTRQTYYRFWRLFNQFFIRLDKKPNNWEDRLVLFTGFLIENKLQSSSIKSYLSTIRCVLTEHRIEVNEDRFLINSLTRACKIKNACLQTKLLIRRDLNNLLITEREEQPALSGDTL